MTKRGHGSLRGRRDIMATHARVSIRKMGTRAGKPHYGAQCVTCGAVLAVAYLSREACERLADDHRRQGCNVTLRWLLSPISES